MSAIQISERYAKALFELANEQGGLDDVHDAMVNIGQMASQVPSFYEFIKNPLLSQDERAKVIAAIFSKSPELVHKFLLYLSQKGRFNILPAIVEAFDCLYLATHNRVRAVVETALPLDEEVKAHIHQYLSQKYHKDVVEEWQIKEDIIGGLRILIEGKLHDYSFTSQLEQFRQKALS